MSRYQAADEVLINTWIIYQQFGNQLERENDYWAVMRLDEVCRNDPMEGLELVLAILARNAKPFIVEALRTGPLQLLQSHGDQSVDEAIERAAQNEPVFASLLSGQ